MGEWVVSSGEQWGVHRSGKSVRGWRKSERTTVDGWMDGWMEEKEKENDDDDDNGNLELDLFLSRRSGTGKWHGTSRKSATLYYVN